VRAKKRWHVDVLISEGYGRTLAEAALETELGDRLIGVGHARLSPDDIDVPEIGHELAVARALRNLGTRLLATTSADIEGMTDEPVCLDH
jgi:Domain of unknown function (DUF1876)